MATINFKKGDEYLAKIAALSVSAAEEVCGAAIYAGARTVTDAIADAIDGIPVDESFGTPENPQNGIKQKQKTELKAALGISRAQSKNGMINVKIGFDGYNSIKTKRWPKGQPNSIIARSLERGTSWMKAYPFVKNTMRKITKQAQKDMSDKVDEKIKEIMK